MFGHLVAAARDPERTGTHGISAKGWISSGFVHPLLRPDESCYAFLALLLTGDPCFAELGKERLRQVLGSMAEREVSESCQLHTWCDAFPMARYAIYHSWLAQGGFVSPEEDFQFRESFLSYCRFHAFERLRARHRGKSLPNNQNGAMAFACVMAGLLCTKDGEMDPRARDISLLGHEHLINFVTGFPEGGYSGEGSGYMLGVNAFLLVLSIEILEAATPGKWFDFRRDAGSATPHETLLAMVAQCTRHGLSYPWDDYGYMRPKHCLAASYLAWRTGDYSPLRFLLESGAAFDTLHVGWGFEHRLWMLLYWPDGDIATLGEDCSLNFTNPTTHASAEGPARKLNFLQIWDRGDWPPARSHCNPNSITVEYAGVPLIVEGRPWNPAPERFEAAGFVVPNRWGGGKINIGSGAVCSHNCLIVDEEDWFASKSEAGGALVKASWIGGFSYICADVTEAYAERYGLSQVRRESLVIGDELIVIRDCIDSATSHRYRWNSHLAPGALTQQSGGIRLDTDTGLAMGLSNALGEEFTGFATGRCNEVSYPAEGKSVRLMTTIAIDDHFLILEDLSDRWAFLWAGEKGKALELAGTDFAGPEIDLSKGPWFYSTQESRPGWALLRREFSLEAMPGAPTGLRLPRHAMEVVLLVNGHEIPVPFIQDETELVPSFIDCSSRLQIGENVIVIISDSSIDNSLFGQILFGSIAPPRPLFRIEEPEPDHFLLARESLVHHVFWGDDVRGISHAGVKASARVLLLHGINGGCAFDASSIVGGSFSVRSNQPVDVAWSEHGLSFGRGEEETRADFCFGNAIGHVQFGNSPKVVWDTPERVAVHINSSDRRDAIPVEWQHPGSASTPSVEMGKSPALGPPRFCAGDPAVISEIASAPLAVRRELASVIRDHLESPNWKDRLYALHASVGIDDPALVGTIFRILDWESRNHPTSFQPTADDPSWYRTKAAAARALGSVRFEKAVPILHRILHDRATIYPARVAAAEALASIGNEEARLSIAAVEPFDEFNVASICRDAIQTWKNQK